MTKRNYKAKFLFDKMGVIGLGISILGVTLSKCFEIRAWDHLRNALDIKAELESNRDK